MENQAQRVQVELTAEEYRQIEKQVTGSQAQMDAVFSALLLKLAVRFNQFVAENGLQDVSIDVHIERPDQDQAHFDVEEDSDEDIVAGFRQSWHEAMTGNTRPISELWDGLDDE